MRKKFISISTVCIMLIVSSLGLTCNQVTGKAKQADAERGTLVIKKCQDFKVTGNGGSDAWKGTSWVKLNQQGPDYASYETRVKVLYSETGIYFLFDCEDKKLTSTIIGDQQNIYTEDVVEVFLWTEESFPVYFEYELSPMNYELTIMVPNYKGKFLGWLPWHYEGDKRTQHETSVSGGSKESGSTVKGWKAEFFIPYKLLAPLPEVPPVSGTKWRANMYRIDYDKGTAHYAWQKTNKSFHEYDKFGTFIFE
ncbi:MAG TPA: carbohydrate-binding family 9-like protein [Bacteroidales bacterium]|nr:carbohydrate-binding family 9-like protein [Bacteroidales bacterium]HPM88251.1 carbohydrate-binding family 9-like protein [Bacteroidales bacterium]